MSTLWHLQISMLDPHGAILELRIRNPWKIIWPPHRFYKCTLARKQLSSEGPDVLESMRLLSCWPKVEWQARFWTLKGFIYYLGDVSIPLLQQQCEWLMAEEKPKSSWPDRRLYLSITCSPDAIKAAMSFTCDCNLKEGFKLRGDNINNLTKALRRVNDKTASD